VITKHPKHYLLASDFDQTLSFNDSGLVLSELLGISGFQRFHMRDGSVMSGAGYTIPLQSQFTRFNDQIG